MIKLVILKVFKTYFSFFYFILRDDPLEVVFLHHFIKHHSLYLHPKYDVIISVENIVILKNVLIYVLLFYSVCL